MTSQEEPALPETLQVLCSGSRLYRAAGAELGEGGHGGRVGPHDAEPGVAHGHVAAPLLHLHPDVVLLCASMTGCQRSLLKQATYCCAVTLQLLSPC